MPSGASWLAPPPQASPLQAAAQRSPSTGMPPRAATSSSGSLPEAWVRVQAVDPARAGPPIKHGWSDDEGLPPGKRGYTCCTKFRFAIWLAIVVGLVAAAVGLSVAMAVIMKNRSSDNPAPAPAPGSNDAGGGSESGGNGNLGEPARPWEREMADAGGCAVRHSLLLLDAVLLPHQSGPARCSGCCPAAAARHPPRTADPLPPPTVQPDWVPAGQQAIW